MSDEDISHIRDGIEEIRLAIALHDQNAGHYVERIVATEERIAEAVTEMAKSTVEIKAAVVQLAKNGNGNGNGSFKIDRKTLMWLIGLAVAGALGIGGGSELTHRLFHDAFDVPMEQGK